MLGSFGGERTGIFQFYFFIDNVPNFVKLVTEAYKQTLLLTYKTYHISCDLSNRQARVRSNRWMQCEARSQTNQGG